MKRREAQSKEEASKGKSKRHERAKKMDRWNKKRARLSLWIISNYEDKLIELRSVDRLNEKSHVLPRIIAWIDSVNA